jgi:hypothetical protein
MRRLFRWVFRILILLVALGGLAVLLRNVVGRAYLESLIRRETGLHPIVGRLHVPLGKPEIVITDFRLMNPPSLSTRPFLDAAEIRVRYDPGGIPLGRLHIRSVEIRLSEATTVRGADGASTVGIMKREFLRNHPDGHLPLKGLLFMGIDKVALSLGRIRYIDHAQPALSQEEWLGLKNYSSKSIRSWAGLEAFLRQLAADKRLRPQTVGLFPAPTNAVPGQSKPAADPAPQPSSG